VLENIFVLNMTALEKLDEGKNVKEKLKATEKIH